ncbi:MAG: PAS domain S-box protein [Campylobacteraceae bacterium]|nr:PAS domain S-box protein [Campylobacteraceae bacterium]
MLVMILLLCITFLASTSFLLWILWNKQKREIKTLQLTSSLFENIYDTLPLPIFYKKKKNAGQSGNKAFHHSFGDMNKEVFEELDLLAKNGEHTLTLTYDNGIKKNSTVYLSPLLDKHHKIFGFTGAILDISSLQKSKELLLAQKQRLELALEGSGDGLWDWDMSNDTFFYSPRWKSIMGYEPQESPNSLASWLNLVHPKDMATLNEKLKIHLDEKNELFFAEHRIRDSQPLRWIAVRGKIIIGKNNKARRMVGTIRDISERKKNEEEHHQYQDLFASFVSHLPTIAFIKDLQGKYLYMNNVYQKYIGFQTWQNKNAHELFDATSADEIEKTDRIALYEGVIEHEIMLPTEEGDTKLWKVYKFPIENAEGEKYLCGFGMMINKPFSK